MDIVYFMALSTHLTLKLHFDDFDIKDIKKAMNMVGVPKEHKYEVIAIIEEADEDPCYFR